MQREKRRVQVGSSYLYFQRVGSGAPLILLHGLSGSGRWWLKNVTFFARRYEVFVIDLIGFGKSRRRQKFVLREAASLLDRWMEQLHIGPAVVLGHSMGGVIALDLAARHPHRVQQMVLVDPATLAYQRSYLQNIRGLLQAVYRLPLSFLPVLFSDALRAGPSTLVNAAGELLLTDMTFVLRSIKAPTLIVWGEHDKVVPIEIGKRIFNQIVGSRMVVIDRAGHNPMWDRPRIFNQVVLEFLQHNRDRGISQPLKSVK